MSNSLLTPGQIEVLRAFLEHGPMHDAELATFVHHRSPLNMSSSGIRTRRAELTRTDPPLVQASGIERRMKSGRNAAVHSLTVEGYQIAADLESAAVVA